MVAYGYMYDIKHFPLSNPFEVTIRARFLILEFRDYSYSVLNFIQKNSNMFCLYLVYCFMCGEKVLLLFFLAYFGAILMISQQVTGPTLIGPISI